MSGAQNPRQGHDAVLLGGAKMSYNLEALGDERFQQLCQALLTCAYPNVQCLPVAQPDGGRDAFLLQRKATSSGEFVIFQVKFVKDPKAREARDVVEQV